MKDKENIIELYKAFISNEKIPLLVDFGSTYYPRVELGEKKEHRYSSSSTSEVTYKYWSDYKEKYYQLNDEDKVKLDYDFKTISNKLTPSKIEITLNLESLPPIELVEVKEVKVVSDDFIDNIPYKGIRGRWFGYTGNIKVIIKKLVTTRTITYGSIVIKLTSTEFKELKAFYDEHLKVRPNQLDRVQLKTVSKKYVKH